MGQQVPDDDEDRVGDGDRRFGPDFLPIRRFSRRSRAPSRLWMWSVAQAASTRMVHRWAWPCELLPLSRTP
jgi:hypothetical protein